MLNFIEITKIEKNSAEFNKTEIIQQTMKTSKKIPKNSQELITV